MGAFTLTRKCMSGSWLARLLPVLLPLGLFLVTALRGVDFGNHWDELGRADQLARMVESRTLLPGTYRYPSLIYWVGLGASAVDLARSRGSHAEQGASDAPRAHFRTESVRLRFRAVLVVLSGIAVLALYLAVLTWRGSPAEACLAATLLAGSAEFVTHARWPAPDGLQVACTCVALLGFARLAGGARWGLGLAAVGVGLACSAKYTAGALTVPLFLVAAWAMSPGTAWGPRFRRGSRAVLLAGGVFLLTTPGALLQPTIFLNDVRAEVVHYATGHGAYTVEPGREHLRLALDYVVNVQFAAARWLAVLPPLLALLGAAVSLRRRSGFAAILVGYSLFHLGYMATQRVMFVRNLQVLAPCLAALAAAGLGELVRWTTDRRWRGALVTAVVLATTWNGVEGLRAAEGIRARERWSPLGAVSDYVDRSPRVRFHVSEQLEREWLAVDGRMPPNVTTLVDAPSDLALLWMSEGLDWHEWPANRRDTFERVFGTAEVNVEYYPSWRGGDRVVALDIARARELGVRTVRPDLPDDGERMLRQAEFLRSGGDPRESLARYDRFLRMRSDHLVALTGRAAALAALGRIEDARADLARARALRPDYPGLSEAWASLGDE